MKRTKPDFCATFRERYPSRAYILPILCEACGHTKLTWSDMTRVNLTRFVSLLKERYAPNSATVLAGTLKSLLNLYQEEVKLPCADFAKVLSISRVPSQHIALTENELMRIEQYEPQSQREADIKNLAMREALTGARGCDAALLSMENIGDDGLLSYVSSKTKRLSVLPVHRLLPQYLNAPVTDHYARMTKNRVLQHICMAVGIDTPCKLYVNGRAQAGPKWRFVGFHTLRRTFASIMASKGVPLSVIQGWMGHATPTQTTRYVCIDTNEANKQYASLFK